MAVLGTVGYSTATTEAEGGSRLIQFSLWDCATHGVFINVSPTMTHDDKAQRIMEYDRYLRQMVGIPLNGSRTQDMSENVHRMNELMLCVLAWATACQGDKDWANKPMMITLGDYIFAALASLYVAEKKKSVKALSTILEKEPGIRGRLDAAVKIALGKKPGEDADSK